MAAYAGARVAAKEIGAKYNVDVVIDWQTPKNEDAQEQVQAVDQMSRSVWPELPLPAAMQNSYSIYQPSG